MASRRQDASLTVPVSPAVWKGHGPDHQATWRQGRCHTHPGSASLTKSLVPVGVAQRSLTSSRVW